MNAHVVSLRSMGLNCYPLSDRIDISSVASSGSALVSLECEKYPSEIRYTTDGSTPCSSSPLYEKPFEVTEPVLVKASRFESCTPLGVDSLFVGTDSSMVEYFPYVEPDHWKNL